MRRINKNSIGFRLATLFVCIVLLQCIVMGVMLVAGGVISETEENSYSYFSSQVESRKANLESQIKLMWTDFSTIPEQIAQAAAEYRINTPLEKQTDDDLLRTLAPSLIELLKKTKTTGVFLILPNQNEDGQVGEDRFYSALYIRNLDPNQKGQDSYNLTLKAGPMDLKKTHNFATSDKWEYKLRLNENNEEFYKKTYENMQYDVGGQLLHYWSKPFALYRDTTKVMSYSIPLKDSNNQEIGVLGVDISINYLYEFLPKADLVGDNSLGFIIAKKDDAQENLYPVIAKENLHGKVIDLNEPIEYSEKNKGLNIYEITNTLNDNHIFSCEKRMNLYSGNTPFAMEEWYLIGLMNKSELLKFPDRIASIMQWSLGATIILGIIASVFISKRFSKPIVRLADEVRLLSDDETTQEQILSKTALYEIDQLSEAVLSAQKRLHNLNDKLKYERDRDAMTNTLNRHAFNIKVEYYNLKKHDYKSICMGIFDLNWLKEVNDRYGHECGDIYICDAAKLISEIFNESLLFRIGGDEFAIIMTNINSDLIEEKQKKLNLLVKKYNLTSKFEAGIAFGYSFCLYEEEESLEQALKRADIGMYAVKKRMKDGQYL